jgi:hypothetical protein
MWSPDVRPRMWAEISPLGGEGPGVRGSDKIELSTTKCDRALELNHYV